MTIYELEKLASILEADWHVRAAALLPNSTDAELDVVDKIRTAAEQLRAAAASAGTVLLERSGRLATREEAAEFAAAFLPRDEEGD
jgi:hypothetical protein